VSVCNVGVFWPNGWIDQDETRREGRPRPWPHGVRWGSISLNRDTAPSFQPMYIVANIVNHIIYFRLSVFSGINISQGSVATRLRCGGIFYNSIPINLLLSLSVK